VIREAFRTLVEAPGPRAAADRIAAEAAAMIPPAAMVSELEELAHAGVAR
jgi:hypothetical protein